MLLLVRKPMLMQMVPNAWTVILSMLPVTEAARAWTAMVQSLPVKEVCTPLSLLATVSECRV